MAYIGKSPDGTGVRSRFYYTQTSGGGTSVTGSSDDGTSLAFSDGAYVDVFLNGVLLVAGTDYNTTTTNTIAGLAALANGDVVEVVVYDIFTVADTVSSLNGGTFSGAVGFSGGITGDLAVPGHASVGVNAVDTTRALTVAGSTDDSTASGLVVYNSSLASKFSVRNDGLITTAGDIQVGGGLYVGGTGAANHLDDYEEGTWTASFNGSSGTATGYYVKVGRQVFVTVYSGALNVTSSGTATISGLPFTNNGPYTAASVTHDTYSNNSYNAYVQENGTTITAIQDGTVSGAQTVVGNPKYIMVSAVYYTNS